MGELGNFQLGQTVAIGWLLQVALIASVGLRGRAAIRLREPSLLFCLLVISLAWVWRLATLFALEAGGLAFWIGDDAVRWIDAWAWLRSPYLTAPESPWLVGTSLVHGMGILLVGDPLYGSKLVSALLCVFPLAGLFLFAHALLRSRALAALSVVFLAPSWLGILLASGTMSETPTTGFMLAGAGLGIAGLRTPAGDARAKRLVGGGLCFAAATCFHMVAWFHLTGILVALLAYVASRAEGSLRERLVAWVRFSALATIFCWAWVLNAWALTGSLIGSFGALIDVTIWKIGGPTALQHHLEDAAGPGAVWALAMALATLALLGAAWALGQVREEGGARLRERFSARRLRSLKLAASGVALVSALTAAFVVLRHAPALPAPELERLAINLLVYPTALLYCLWLILPLAVFGLAVALLDARRRVEGVRWALAALGAGLLVLVASALMGGANVTPFRSVWFTATALVPIVLVPLFSTSATAAPSAQSPSPPRSRREIVCIGLAGLVFAQLLIAQHQRILAELPVPSLFRAGAPIKNYAGDTHALGTWLRAERLEPTHLDAVNWSHPLEVVTDDQIGGLLQSVIEYSAGNPGWFARPERPHRREPGADLLGELVPGQVAISDKPIDRGELRHIATIGRYYIYERRRP